MPRRALQADTSSAPALPRRPAPALAAADARARVSPAQDLQRRVQARFETGGVSEESKWSTRRSLAFIVGSSCALWAGIGGLAYIALR